MKKEVELELASMEAECDTPPLGWRCTRGKGHSGPCAAVEWPEDLFLVERGMRRLRETPSTEGNNDEIRKLLKDNPAKPYWRMVVLVDRNLRRINLVLWDCSVCEIQLTRRIALLVPNHRKWWQPPVCGAVFLY